MARFIFRLQGVLRQRIHIERQKQRDLAERQKAQIDIENAMLGLQNEVQASNDDLRRNRLVGRLDMEFIAAHRRYLVGVQRQAVGLAQRLSLAQRGVNEARAELAEAARQRKAIEKLREKQLERWRTEQARREAAQMDEIGMQLAYENLSLETDRTQ
jgi:flagellar FliJ protein